MTFAAGGSKKGDKIQINKGIVASDETRKMFDKIAAENPALVTEKPVMKRRPRPLYDRVVIRAATVEEVSKGGIILAPTNAERPREGTVVFIGAGAIDVNGIRRPMDVKEGNTVLFGQYAGTEVKIDGETVLMMKESEILAVIE
jgi:chaperonin GroES